jgi:hemolysin activation/secretion protein
VKVNKPRSGKKTAVFVLASILSTAAFSAINDDTNKNQVGTWTIQGNHLISSTELVAAVNASADKENGLSIGNTLVALYRKRGYLSIEASVDADKQTITLFESTAVSTGIYGDYIPKGQGVLTNESLELAAARMTNTAKLNGEKINIEILSVDPQTGNAEIRTTATPIVGDKKIGASIGYSNMGQRYSGPDVATAYGWANIGNGQQLDVSAAHGFSAWSNDSKGGRFESGVLSYRKASQFGLTSIQTALTTYKTGGIFSEIDLTGTINRTTLEHNYLVKKNIIAIGRLSYTDNEQKINLVGWTNKQSYTAFFGGFRYQGESWAADAGIEQGLGGSSQFNFVPLLGRFDANYTTLAANVTGNFDLSKGWIVAGKAGFQSGPNSTPSSAQFALGGPDRGRSYTTGYVATPIGAYASLTLNAPLRNGVQGYAGIDWANGKPVTGPSREATSAFIGARFMLSKLITGDLSFAQAIKRNDDPSAGNSKFNFVVSASF